MSDFIDDLTVDDLIKSKLRKLGASSAPALLSLLQSAPESARPYLGFAMESVINQLRSSLKAHEAAILRNPVRAFSQGANVSSPPPGLRSPPYDIAKRDKLFEEVQVLRRKRNTSTASKERIAELEKQLTEMLER